MAPARASSSDAFPSDTYAKYKRATEYFLRWLLRARGSVGVGDVENVGDVGNSQRKPLDVYDKIVDAIAANPAALTPSLLQLYPLALEACESAITLRARVALFLAESADDAHAHFLDRMMTWFSMLQRAYVPPSTSSSSSRGSKPTKRDARPNKKVDFSNYYDVLALPDDYFHDDARDGDAIDRPTVPTLSAADQKRLFDDAFGQDLNAELACLFMELEELSEAVYAVYYDVKREKKTLVEATAVAKVAIDCATSVIAKLQLRYPFITSGEDICELIQERLSVTELGRLVTRIGDAWQPSDDMTDVKYQYVPGTILVDLLWVGRALLMFAGLTKDHPKQRVSLNSTHYGERYDEDETPHYTVPDWTTPSHFFMQQLPLLHNALIDFEKNGISLKTPFLETWFLEQFDGMRKTGVVSVHLIFIGICWIRSVAALQRNRGLSRTISLSMLYRWDLHERITRLLVTKSQRPANDHFTVGLEALQSKINTLERRAALHRFNPILAGGVQIDLQTKFLELGNDSLLKIPFFRAFCHLYSALRTRQLLDEIPFVEDAIRVYESGVFTPNRAASTHGMFARSYLGAKNLVQASINSQSSRRTSSSELPKSALDRMRLLSISPSFRLLYMKDYSVLPSDLSTSSSWKTLVSAVCDLFTVDLFDTRVLSRDMLSVTNDLSLLFHQLCDEFDRRPQFERILAGITARVSREVAVALALENAVMFPLVPLLDSVTDDEINAPVDKSEGRLVATSNGSTAAMCHRASALIMQHFAKTRIEELFFVFPATPNWATREFGSPVCYSDLTDPGSDDEEEFEALMEMMETHIGPLRGNELMDFKRRVIAKPILMKMAYTSSEVEWNTLFHHAAAGPSGDRRLTEWMIQRGALIEESPHCRFPEEAEREAPSKGIEEYWDNLAMHLAARKRLTDVVKVILDASNFRDLDTTTYRTKESLMHIAVKTGNRHLFNLLASMGANIMDKNANGKHVWELTKDRSWLSLIKTMSRLKNADGGGAKPTRSILKSKDAKAETIRKALQTQRDAERAGSTNGEGKQHGAKGVNVASKAPVQNNPTLTEPTPSTTKKKSNKKKKKKKGGASQPETSDANGSATTPGLMEQLFTSPDASAKGDRIQRLSQALDKLKEDTETSSEERETNAAIVIDIVTRELVTIVDSVAKVGYLSTVPAHREELLETARVVFLLEEFRKALTRPLQTLKEPQTELDKLHMTLQPADDAYFKRFYEVAIKATLLLVYCDEVATTDKLVAICENWLLEIKDRSDGFRELVRHYIKARHSCQLQPRLGSTPQVERQLQWYESHHGVENKTMLAKLDRLYGCCHYIHLKVSGGFQTHRFRAWMHRMETATPYGNDIIDWDDHVIAGARTQDAIIDIVKAIVDASAVTGLKFELWNSLMDVPVMPLLGFEFSATGIVPLPSP